VRHACLPSDCAAWSQGVFFGQLLGMADQLTFPLGRSGYRVRALLCQPAGIFFFPHHSANSLAVERAAAAAARQEASLACLSVACTIMPRQALSPTGAAY